MRHALGLLGVLAAAVLLAVSAAMNWRFGLQLGKTELDGQIYGAASAAADCLKALVPFLLFAAIRNRMWSQALAAVLVWTVCTSYSLTSALGHAALNRQDSTGKRAMQAAAYKDLRTDLKRAQGKLSWIPEHRPAATVAADIDAVKTKRPWRWTNGCADVKGRTSRNFCQQYYGLTAELASAREAGVLETRISAIKHKLASTGGGSALSEADPQATVLAKLSGFDVETVQTALTVFIALLIEIGSGFGMYVAFAQWRIDQPRRLRVALPAEATTVVATVAAVVPQSKPNGSANDNRTAPAKLVAPDSDVERFYRDRIEEAEESSLTATMLYEDYCAWCEEQAKEPLALPTFGRQFGERGVEKAKVAGRIRYMGIKLNTSLPDAGNNRLLSRRAA